ncbi:MAG: hypothetical protein HDS03_06325 [Bacteroides sp.]|nr:hypothetical protein [Bacteroides sp.]MDE7441749.1 hypothetical protein [Muribaculaceae bacterium]
MKAFKKLAFCAALAAAALPTYAQKSSYSGYFLDNYTYRFQMNPAFANEQNFVSMPALGNLNVSFAGNLHLTDVFYNVNGRTALFTNPEVNASKALKKFGNREKFMTNEKIDILSGGFKAWGGYNTVSISAVANAGVSLPKSFFQLAKEGISNKTYDIQNVAADVNAYAQIAFNHSRDIKQVPGLRAGAAVKFLIGVGALQAKFNEADLTLGTDNWIARTNADIYASVGGFRFEQKRYEPKGDSGMQPYDYVSGAKIDNFGIQGFGMAFDLGAEYKWNDFKFSAAILDLGFISWGKTQWASTNGTQTVETDAYTFNADGDADNSFKNEFNNLKDDFSKLYQLTVNDPKGSYTRGLATTLNFAVDYIFPYYRNLHFGLVNSTRIYGPFTTTQFRLSANVAPVKIFSADINLGVGTYGADFGWMLNLNTLKGFNLFIGMDHTLGKLCKQGIPLNSNGSFNFGMNFPF